MKYVDCECWFNHRQLLVCLRIKRKLLNHDNMFFEGITVKEIG